MSNFFNAGLIVFILSGAFIYFKMYSRAMKARAFLSFVNTLRYDYVMRNLVVCTFHKDKHPDEWLDHKIPNQSWMVLSNKPFTLAAWFDQDTINMLYATHKVPSPEEIKEKSNGENK